MGRTIPSYRIAREIEKELAVKRILFVSFVLL
jgi:hypothetical protein